MSSEMMVIDMVALERTAEQLVQSKYSTERNPVDALWLIATGAGLGIDPATSLRAIHVIKGKPVLSADLMSAVAMRHPACEYLIVRKMTAELCEIATKRRGWPEEVVMSWTSEDAKRAGLSGDNWRKYPQAMLKARCLGQIVRAAYPDALMGCYVEGELDEQRAPRTVEDAEVFVPEHIELLGACADSDGDDRDTTQDTTAKDWSEDEQWKRAQKFYRVLISEGDVLDRGELEQVHIYTRRILGVTSSKHIDPTRFRRLNSQIAAVPVEDRAEWLRSKVAATHPNPIETDLAGPERTPSAA